MKSRVMIDALDALRAGTIGFPEFRRRTEKDWQRIARYLLRRWDAPDGVEDSDVVQELLLASWRFVHEWQPKRGVTLSRYVVWNACDKAKKWIHSQRRAFRRDDSAPSRHPLSFSALGLEDWQEERLAVVRPEVDDLVERAEERERLSVVVVRLAPVALELGDVDRYVLGVLVEAGGDVGQAARDLWDDRAASLTLRLGSESAAENFVLRVISRARTVTVAVDRGISPAAE